MRELIERNGLEPEAMVSCLFTTTEDLDAEFPAVAARDLGLDNGAAAVLPRDPRPRLDAAGDPGDAPLLRAGGARARPRLRRRGAEAAGRPPRRPVAALVRRPSQSAPMTITFAEKLARMPGYQAGVPTGQAPEAIAAGEHRPARLQRVAVPAAPEGGRGDRSGRRRR